jgi:1,5-anhydro-D-fructose reductase (1,5-anhydro-D-mannitol-forming)
MTVRWGILGCGDVCEVKSGPAFQRATGSELVAVMRRDRAKAEDFARRHGVPAFYDDADALIADPQVDAVYIATPPGNHLELALKVAAANKPAYIEKPMARTFAECWRMVEAFELAKVPLFVAYYRRALARFLKAKEIVEQGVLGDIVRVDVRYASNGHGRYRDSNQALPWRMQAEHAGGGLFFDLASHTLDVLDFLFGPLQGVTGEARNGSGVGDVEDRVELQFSTLSGAAGTGSWSFSKPDPADATDVIAITGKNGMLCLATFGDTPVELRSSAGVQHFELPNPRHIHQPLVQLMVDALHGRGACPSTGVSAARTSDAMDRAVLGYYGTRVDGFWKDPTRWPARGTRVT